jgi:hypothetical protein
MDGAIESRREEAERLRDYFEVQLRFADILAARTSRALADICLEFTNLHRRLGLGRTDGSPPTERWMHYATGLESCASTADRLQWTVDCLANAPLEKRNTRKFGCFSYEMIDNERVVRIHFGNYDSANGIGPLVRAKAERRRSELREMFTHIRAHHPLAQTVRGGSWLYNVEAYRRLFPSAYTASAHEPARVRLDGTSSWGQVIDFRERVRPTVRRAILDNAATVDVATPWQAFPLRALAVQSAIAAFPVDR